MDCIKDNKYMGIERRLSKEDQTCAFHKDNEEKVDRLCKKMDTVRWFIILNIAVTSPSAITYIIKGLF